MSTPPDAFAALRNPNVRAFALGRIAAVVGMQVLNVAVGWELYERTGNPLSLGLVGLVEVVPVVLLVVPSGNAADRFPRRNVAMLAHLALALAAAGLLFASREAAPLPVVYALLAFIGASRAFAAPAVATILPQLLPSAQFVNANAWLSSGFQVAAVAGPAVGGALIAWTGGASAAYATALVGQLVFIALLSRLPAVVPDRVPRARNLRELFVGLAFIRKQPVFLAAITLDLFAVLFGGAYALFPVFAKDVLDVGAAGLGWLRAAPSLGALLTALVLTRLSPWKRPGRVLLVTVSGFGLATIGFGLSKTFPLSLAFLFLTGVFDEVSVVIRATLEQVITPDALRGRVSAMHYVFIGFSNELGSFESGGTAALFGPIASVVGGGVGTLLVVALVAYVWPSLARLGPLHTLSPSAADDVAA